mmetsp:Transcript_5188/g.6692  ORF Transcript_5188/g.6692 Transcript_5188/m.6692 type:complete len:89 (-) Transcript_5188:984-1250(-)
MNPSTHQPINYPSTQPPTLTTKLHIKIRINSTITLSCLASTFDSFVRLLSNSKLIKKSVKISNPIAPGTNTTLVIDSSVWLSIANWSP